MVAIVRATTTKDTITTTATTNRNKTSSTTPITTTPGSTSACAVRNHSTCLQSCGGHLLSRDRRKRARPPGLYTSKIADLGSAIWEVVNRSRFGKSPTEATGLDGSRRSGFARLSVSHQIWVHRTESPVWVRRTESPVWVR
ncbi:hypothetical protein NL676_014376 [Syzygium grande]|nr:hypothetical protein NL676_014376 [Syzygium grande]